MAYTNVTRRKLYLLWYNIRRRCYDQTNPRYSLYGGKGIRMCDKWLTFDRFLEDIIYVPGYNEQKLLQGKIFLDKDLSNAKLYSKDTCSFVDIATSNKCKPNQMLNFIAISPTGKRYVSNNQSEFAREHNLRQTSISDCLRGRLKSHNKWTFSYEERSTTIEKLQMQNLVE